MEVISLVTEYAGKRWPGFSFSSWLAPSRRAQPRAATHPVLSPGPAPAGAPTSTRPSSPSSVNDSSATAAAAAGTSPAVRVEGAATRGSVTRSPSG